MIRPILVFVVFVVMTLLSTSLSSGQDLDVPKHEVENLQTSKFANQTRVGRVGHMEIVRYWEYKIRKTEEEYLEDMRAWRIKQWSSWNSDRRPLRYRVVRHYLGFVLHRIVIHFSENDKKEFVISWNLYNKLSPGDTVEVPYNQVGPIGVRISEAIN